MSPLESTRIITLPGPEVVRWHTPSGSWAARMRAVGRVAASDVLGRAAGERIARRLAAGPPDVGVAYRPSVAPTPPIELVWPYPPDDIVDDWGALSSADLDRMDALARPTIEALADAIARRAPARARVHEVGCSTGAMLAALAERRPDLGLSGVDRVPSMVERARGRAPTADIRVADASAPGPPVDLVVSRLLAWNVVPPAEVDALLASLVAAVAPGGLLVLGAFLPLVVDRARLDAHDLEVDTMVRAADDGWAQLYIATRPRPA